MSATDKIKEAFPYQIGLGNTFVEASDDSDLDNHVTHYLWDIVAVCKNEEDAIACLVAIEEAHPGCKTMLFDYTKIKWQPDDEPQGE